MQSFCSKQNSEIHAKTIFQRMSYVKKCVNVSWRMLTHKSATEKFWCIFNWRNKTLICYYCMNSNNNKWTYFYNVERWPIENAESCKLEEIQNFIVFVFCCKKYCYIIQHYLLLGFDRVERTFFCWNFLEVCFVSFLSKGRWTFEVLPFRSNSWFILLKIKWEKKLWNIF